MGGEAVLRGRLHDEAHYITAYCLFPNEGCGALRVRIIKNKERKKRCHAPPDWHTQGSRDNTLTLRQNLITYNLSRPLHCTGDGDDFTNALWTREVVSGLHWNTLCHFIFHIVCVCVSVTLAYTAVRKYCFLFWNKANSYETLQLLKKTSVKIIRSYATIFFCTVSWNNNKIAFGRKQQSLHARRFTDLFCENYAIGLLWKSHLLLRLTADPI